MNCEDKKKKRDQNSSRYNKRGNNQKTINMLSKKDEILHKLSEEKNTANPLSERSRWPNEKTNSDEKRKTVSGQKDFSDKKKKKDVKTQALQKGRIKNKKSLERINRILKRRKTKKILKIKKIRKRILKKIYNKIERFENDKKALNYANVYHKDCMEERGSKPVSSKLNKIKKLLLKKNIVVKHIKKKEKTARPSVPFQKGLNDALIDDKKHSKGKDQTALQKQKQKPLLPFQPLVPFQKDKQKPAFQRRRGSIPKLLPRPVWPPVQNQTGLRRPSPPFREPEPLWFQKQRLKQLLEVDNVDLQKVITALQKPPVSFEKKKEIATLQRKKADVEKEIAALQKDIPAFQKPPARFQKEKERAALQKPPVPDQKDKQKTERPSVPNQKISEDKKLKEPSKNRRTESNNKRSDLKKNFIKKRTTLGSKDQEILILERKELKNFLKKEEEVPRKGRIKL